MACAFALTMADLVLAIFAFTRAFFPVAFDVVVILLTITFKVMGSTGIGVFWNVKW